MFRWILNRRRSASEKRLTKLLAESNEKLSTSESKVNALQDEVEFLTLVISRQRVQVEAELAISSRIKSSGKL
jgi:hypothetical protein